MNTTDQPTPRTDALWKQLADNNSSLIDGAIALREKAEELERELAAMTAELEKFTAHGCLDVHMICDQRDTATLENAALKGERDTLRAQIAAKDAALNDSISLINHLGGNPKHQIKALSPGAGKGWLSPEEAALKDAQHLLQNIERGKQWTAQVEELSGKLLTATNQRDTLRAQIAEKDNLLRDCRAWLIDEGVQEWSVAIKAIDDAIVKGQA